LIKIALVAYDKLVVGSEKMLARDDQKVAGYLPESKVDQADSRKAEWRSGVHQ
jgi:hypothetical protein